MKKIVNLLEAYVEWLVLAVGFVFLVMMIWTYLFPPGYVKKELSISGVNKIVTPGSVDEEIMSGPANSLDILMAGSHLDPPPVGDFVSAFDKGVATPANTPPVELATNLLNDQPMQPLQPTQIAKGGGGGGVPLPPHGAAGQVATLPVPPAAQIVATYAGHTTVSPVNPNAAAGAPPVRQDINWATNIALIPKSIADVWNTSFGPAKAGGAPRVGNANTQILVVRSWRQEKSFEGKWSDDTLVKQFEFSALIPPPNPNDLNKQRQYISWAARNVTALANPDFAPRASGFAGTIWKDPKVILQTLIKAPAVKTSEILPEDEFEIPSMPTQAQYTPGAGGSPGGPPGGLGRSIGRAAAGTPPRPPTVKPAAPAVTKAPPALESLDPIVASEKTYHPTSTPSAMPTALFNPSAAAPPVDMMFDFHDDTVQAGHTYRYKVEYTLLNPVFDHKEWVTNPADAQKFGLVSNVSDYGPEITIPANSVFFCNKNFGINNQKFIFDVFAWSDGKWHAHKFVVNPGDSIGQMEQDGTANVDFATRYSYVESGNSVDHKSIVTVVSDDGIVQIRDTSKELESEDHHKYQYWSDNPTATDANPTLASAPPAGPANQTGPGGTTPAAPGFFHPPGAPPGVMIPLPPTEDNP